MNTVTVVSHFSEPRWPIVNKLRAISKCLNVDMIHCSSLEKFQTTARALCEKKVLFFTDEGMIDLVRELDKGCNPRLEVAIIIASTIPKVAEKISSLGVVKYLVAMESIESNGRELSILIKKFSDGDILDLEKYLAFGCKLVKRTILNSAQKREAVDAVSNYVSNLGDPGYSHPFFEYARLVTEVVDELLLNAVFDANPRLKTEDRSLPFILGPDERIEMAWGYDGEYFGVSVRDPFGQLPCETILNYVSAIRERGKVTSELSGGLGLKLIFEKAHQVITNVKNARITEVIALIRLETRMLEYERRQRSFYYFGEQSLKNPVG